MAAEVPLRRRDATGGDRRRGRALRARPPRRAARRRPRARAPARRGLARGRRSGRARPGRDELRPDRHLAARPAAAPRCSPCSARRAWGCRRPTGRRTSAPSRTSISTTTTSTGPSSSCPPRWRLLMPAPEALAAELDRLLATAQAEQRMPSVSACVFRDGEVIWERVLGVADVAVGTRRDERRRLPHRLDHEDLHRRPDHAARPRRAHRPRGAAAHVPPGGAGRADGADGAQPPDRRPARAARRDLGVDAAAVARGADRRPRGCRARASARRAVALLEPRLRPARRDRDARHGRVVRRRPPAADPRSARPHPDEPAARGAQGEPLLRRSRTPTPCTTSRIRR